MADEFDEYEKLLQGNENGDAPAAGSKPREDDEDRSKKERSRERDGDRKRERRERSRSKERSRRDRGRDNDFRVEGSNSRRRSRSRSREKRHRDDRDRMRDRDRPRDRDRDRGRDRDRDRFAPRRRSPTPPEVRLQRERERELKELERATRTVFAFNINIKADERDIYDFFSGAGQVTDIRVITDRHTKRSKGLAYVEFSKQEEVFAALTLTGQALLGQPVMVKPAEAEKNLAWEAAQAAKQNAAPDADLIALGLGDVGLAAPAPAGPLRLQITGFKQGLGENEIRQIFEPFGAIDSISVVRDAAGQPISIAYVVFKSAVDGRNAMSHWHGQTLLDHMLNVTPTALDEPAAAPAPMVGVGELDDEEGGIKIDAQKRAALMSRLASSAGITQPTAVPAAAPGANPFAIPGLSAAAAAAAAVGGILPGGLLAPGMVLPGVAPAVAAAVPGVLPVVDLSLQQGLLGPASPIPTPCLLLKNMFDPTTQTDPDWVAEITEDVRDECSKFGQVLHAFVDQHSKGFVYLKFGSTEGAQAAAKVLHGRFYNGQQIVAEFQFLQTYNQHFGL